MDALAKNGLLYTNMHTTALCSPTRSCILTGRNHHSNHMAGITEVSTGFPGYDGYIPFENGFLSEMLLEHGYSTYAIGKWHLTPFTQISAAGSSASMASSGAGPTSTIRSSPSGTSA
jgi:arylsulfatase